MSPDSSKRQFSPWQPTVCATNPSQILSSVHSTPKDPKSLHSKKGWRTSLSQRLRLSLSLAKRFRGYRVIPSEEFRAHLCQTCFFHCEHLYPCSIMALLVNWLHLALAKLFQSQNPKWKMQFEFLTVPRASETVDIRVEFSCRLSLWAYLWLCWILRTGNYT